MNVFLFYDKLEIIKTKSNYKPFLLEGASCGFRIFIYPEFHHSHAPHDDR